MSAQQDEIERYKRIIDTLPDLVSLFNANLECIYVNQTLVDKTGTPRDEYLGASIDTVLEYLADEDTQEWIETMERLASGERTRAGDTMTVNTGSSKMYIDTTASRIESEAGNLIGIVNVIRNVTERVEAERELKNKNERLEEFASVITHDLRNPLTVAQGRLELAQEDCECEHLAPIDMALNRINRITEDVLWLAREGRDIGSMDALRLRDAANDAWTIVADGFGQAEIQFADIESTATIEADESRLRQLLENLFRNAIEHGSEDVTVTVGGTTDGFYVEDDGPGISKDDREDVFTPGYSTNKAGTGFGLKIVKQIAEAHSWTIRVTNTTYGGAHFEISDVEFITE